ncbi:hypothetical protein HPP92_012376 [Vanilla planifolia]|uniref:peptidylprolyl isomerase n=1 Tax=Vanilla planifolia TaxID=51239 RepID=A0A835R7X7_VANPL|nr:hypothetical protein HPP92_012376 [Vanilla planifolia]
MDRLKGLSSSSAERSRGRRKSTQDGGGEEKAGNWRLAGVITGMSTGCEAFVGRFKGANKYFVSFCISVFVRDLVPASCLCPVADIAGLGLFLGCLEDEGEGTSEKTCLTRGVIKENLWPESNLKLCFFRVKRRRAQLKSSNQLGNALKNSQHSENSEPLKKFDLPSYAVLETTKGSITVELLKDSSPEVVDKFLDLYQKGYFKGMHFHRVIKHFVIQGGDPQNPGAAEEWTLRAKPHDQLETSPKHEAFMLGTSKIKHNAKGFELFITTAPIHDLNDKLDVFGRVIKGEDVVQEIEEVDTDERYHPRSVIEIVNITLKQEP